eukprot:TRINITY_DN3276_c1_g1_i1.p2 TRINITY_DN3276_c1_g1~~TRINITY_DN3276_c1_g1_i1.p2  ORF type:complete len:113 (-),score=7.11 TRINITY_DN3276_c1_g1_i1:86-424(-)
MFVEDVGGDNTLFLMTRHPSSSCRCEDGSCTCGSRENTWIGSCSNGLISFTKELSSNDAWIGSGSNVLTSMTKELSVNDEELGQKDLALVLSAQILCLYSAVAAPRNIAKPN